MSWVSKIAMALFLPVVSYAASDDDIVKIMTYFVFPAEKSGGAYVGSAGDLKDKILPMSYYSTPEYWGNYVARLPGYDPTVIDLYNPKDGTLTPAQDSPGTALQRERVEISNGTHIYDAAAWQIALALGAMDGIGGPGFSLFDIAENQNLLLSKGYDGQAADPHNGANRATTRADGIFSYNGSEIVKAQEAYFFQMVAKNWFSTDPFKGTQYEHYITAKDLPGNPEYKLGEVTWMDWKPVTGENAWAFLIGPLQVAWQRYMVLAGSTYVPHRDLSVQNALPLLKAFRRMQSPLGAVYSTPKGTLGHMSSEPANPYEVSVEENASLLAGLRMLQMVLQAEIAYEPNLTPEEKTELRNASNEIHLMMKGGATPQGYETKGLLAFFQNYAWDKENNAFYQGGLANDPHSGVEWKPVRAPKAVNVSTWGGAVIGQPTLDEWFGFGTAYHVWENVKEWGGFYGPDGLIWGVGCSDQEGNGSHGEYQKGILSGEGTAGAINFVRVLYNQYREAENFKKYTPEEQALAKKFAEQLAADEKSMIWGLETLRTDKYVNESAYDQVRPDNYVDLIQLPFNKLAYLQASKRYKIASGSTANPLPSTASTAWAVMVHYYYNPFMIGGS